jgi:uncharacterized protein YndB with AHSA1/START domain
MRRDASGKRGGAAQWPPEDPLLRGYVHSIEVEAGPGVVWRALTHGPSLALWYAPSSMIEPRQGGRYEVDTRFFGHRAALIDVYDAAKRLRLIYLPDDHWPPLESGPLIEDFIIDRRDGKTVLRLLGSGVPQDPEWDSALKRLRAGWAVAFSYLGRCLKAGEVRAAAS